MDFIPRGILIPDLVTGALDRSIGAGRKIAADDDLPRHSPSLRVNFSYVLVRVPWAQKENEKERKKRRRRKESAGRLNLEPVYDHPVFSRAREFHEKLAAFAYCVT